MTGAEFTPLGNPELGRAKVNWARSSMPLSVSAIPQIRGANPCHIGIALPLNPALASLVLWLMDAGFEVSLLAGCEHSVNTDLLAAVSEAGVTICSSREQFLSQDVDILLDSNGRLACEFGSGIKAATLSSAHCTEGLSATSVPIIQMADSALLERCCYFEGIGQSCVSGFLDITNLQIAGSKVLVPSYDAIGRGVATYAKAYGAQVIVCQDDPNLALQAHLDGHLVLSLETALPLVQVLFNTLETGSALSIEHLASISSGVFLCSATDNDDAFPLAELERQSPRIAIRSFVTEHVTSTGEKVWLLDLIAPNRQLATAVLTNFKQIAGDKPIAIHPIVARSVDPEVLEKMKVKAEG